MLEPAEKHKALTRFLCQELLYEFVIGKLDLDKQKAVDEYLTTDRECQHELERLRRGFVFASLMAKTQMSGEMRASLLGFEPVWKRRLAYWTAWWSRHGWRILPYFVLGGVLILGLAVSKPWVYLRQTEVVLLEEPKNAPAPAVPSAGVQVEPAQVPTEKRVEKVEPIAVEEVPAAPPAVDSATTPAPATAPEPMPSPVPAPATAAALATAPTTAAVSGQDPDLRYWHYRVKIDITEIATVGLAIREKIVALGGELVGKTPLGVERTKGEAYYNFSLLESKQQEFDDFLKTFGPVRIVKQADKLGMPEGKNHIILTVKDVTPPPSKEVTPNEGETPATP